MERREAKEITLDLLLGDQNINADFYASLFNKYRCGDSENTPISPAGMQTVNERNNILLTEETFKDLNKIRDITRRTNQEIAYFIMYENNPVYEGFYIFPTVNLQYENGLVERLPAYQKGDYLVNSRFTTR